VLIPLLLLYIRISPAKFARSFFSPYFSIISPANTFEDVLSKCSVSSARCCVSNSLRLPFPTSPPIFLAFLILFVLINTLISDATTSAGFLSLFFFISVSASSFVGISVNSEGKSLYLSRITCFKLLFFFIHFYFNYKVRYLRTEYS